MKVPPASEPPKTISHVAIALAALAIMGVIFIVALLVQYAV
jgi:hypothetical protein